MPWIGERGLPRTSFRPSNRSPRRYGEVGRAEPNGATWQRVRTDNHVHVARDLLYSASDARRHGVRTAVDISHETCWTQQAVVRVRVSVQLCARTTGLAERSKSGFQTALAPQSYPSCPERERLIAFANPDPPGCGDEPPSVRRVVCDMLPIDSERCLCGIRERAERETLVA